MSFLIKKTTGQHWIVMRTIFEQGKPRRESVPKEAWQALGFTKSMSLEEAKARASALNRAKAVERKEQKAIVAATKRLRLEQVIDSIYTPELECAAFIQYLKNNYAGTKVLSHWNTAQKLLRELRLLPTDFHMNKKAMLHYFEEKEYSLTYVKKLLYVLNLWGMFYCEKHGQYFKPINKLSRVETERIHDAYLDSEGYIGPSQPLTVKDLEFLKDKLKTEQYRWLCFSVWFGLRPAEIDRLRTARVEQHSVPVLVVYQEKLVGVPRNERFKYIPAFLPEQRETLEYLKTELKAPLNKTLKKYLQKNVRRYGGRKAFEDLMYSKGQKFEDISAWLGHTSIEQTWKSYRNKKRVSFTA